MKHYQTPGSRNCKIGSGRISKMAAVTKNSKINKINFFSRTIGYKFSWNISGTLVFNIVKKNKAELGHSDLLSIYTSNFAQMPTSQEKMNVFWSDSITMVPKWNYFIFMQIDNP